MKKTLLRIVAFACLALSVSAAAAADHFKPSGTALQGVVAQAVPVAQALPDNSGAPVAVANESVAVHAQARASIQARRSPGELVEFTADTRPTASLKRIGTHADRGDKARKLDRMRV